MVEGKMYAARRTSNVNHIQREALNTKTHSPGMGVNNRSTENNGLGAGDLEPGFAAVTVNLISNKKNTAGNEDMELIGEDPAGEEREASKEANEENYEAEGISYAETLSFLTESSSELSDEPILLPNILIPCTKCGCIVNICRLTCHRSLHSALQTLKYSHDQRPKNLNALVRRRKLLIKQQQDASSANKQDTFGDKHLHKLNKAFEVLRIELQGNTDARWITDRNLEFNSKGDAFHLTCTTAAGVCEEANKKWKHMEDIHVYQDNFLDNIDSCFFAIYDGYSGRNTAQTCSQHLHVFLKQQLDAILQNEQAKPTKKDITAAFRTSFLKSEKLLLESKEEQSQSRWSGCSAVTCVLTNDTCFVANAGNAGAILLRSNDVVKVLTHKHDLYNKRERDRVKKSRGVVVKTEKCALINGALGVTRGIGSIGDTALKRCVINEPNVKCVSLDLADQLLILASGGFWKIFSYEETVHLVNGFFDHMKDVAKQQIIGSRNAVSTPDQTTDKHGIDVRDNSELFLKVISDTQGKFSHLNSQRRHFPDKSKVNLTRSKSAENLDRLNTYDQDEDEVTVIDNDETNEATYVSDDVTDDVTQPKRDVTIEYLRHHRLSLPDDKTFQLLKGNEEKQLTRPEKESLLAKSLAERLVKCALYAESMDNITVFVVLLPGFSMINWQLVRPDILEALDEFIEEYDE